MSDYTLTTEDIRERFTDCYDGPKAPPLNEARAEFDRWLEQHDKDVALKVKDNIIDMLKGIPLTQELAVLAGWIESEYPDGENK